jgi:hypothetical protein
MDVSDEELVLQLRQRDGDDRRYGGHDPAECRYAEFYEGQTCPWCEAVRRRQERQAGAEQSRN